MQRRLNAPTQYFDPRYARVAGPARVSDIVVWSIAMLLFILVASNGRPMWTSSGIYVVALAPLIILTRGPIQVLDAGLRQGRAWILLSLTAFAVANLVSALATPTFETWEALFLRCLLPLLVYLAVVGIRLTDRALQLVLMAFALGCAVLFARGLLAFFLEWGVPDFSTIMWARFNVVRMAGYSDATVGNVGLMGGFVVLVVPPLTIAALNWSTGRWSRLFFGATAAMGVANLIVSGSRTGIVILFVAILLVLLSQGVKRAAIAVAALFGTMLLSLPLWIDVVLDEEFLARYAPAYASNAVDQSALERLDSIVIGWQTFLENFVFGIGPAMSPYHNIYSVPHQSAVHQLSELGFIGGMTFVWLGVAIIGATVLAAINASTNRQAAFRFLWLIGPGCWMLSGLLSGIAFNLSFALSWIGIANAMLGLSAANFGSVGRYSAHHR